MITDMPSTMYKLSNRPGSLGVSCTAAGLALAGVPLLSKGLGGFVPRPCGEVERLLQGAYAMTADVAPVMSGLGAVARALNEGAEGRAMIAALHLKLPELDWNAAARIAGIEEGLSKYDPGEARDWRGRWTLDGAGVAAAKPPENRQTAAGMAPTPLSFNEAAAPAGAQSDKEKPKDTPVSLPPVQGGHQQQRDLLTRIANATPDQEAKLRAEIRELYYNQGDKRGGEAMDRALSDALDPSIDRAGRQNILDTFEIYTHQDPAEAGQMAQDIVSGALLLPPVVVEGRAGAAAAEVTAAEEAGGAEAAAAEKARVAEAAAAEEARIAEAAAAEEARIAEAAAAEEARVAAVAERARQAGFWKEQPVERGNLIHRLWGANLAHNHPVIDKAIGNIVSSFKSIDLNAASYLKAGYLRSRLNGFINKLADYKGRPWGVHDVQVDANTVREVRVAIPPNPPSNSQRAVMDEMIEIARKRGVTLNFVQVPE